MKYSNVILVMVMCVSLRLVAVESLDSLNTGSKCVAPSCSSPTPSSPTPVIPSPSPFPTPSSSPPPTTSPTPGHCTQPPVSPPTPPVSPYPSPIPSPSPNTSPPPPWPVCPPWPSPYSPSPQPYSPTPYSPSPFPPSPSSCPSTCPSPSPSSSPSPPPFPGPAPPQTQCNGVKALKYPDSNSNIDQISEWTVVRVTPMPQPYPPGFQTTENVCSCFSYVQMCQGMRWYRDVSNLSSTKTYAYYEMTQNMVEYDETLTQNDANYYIFTSTINRMTYYKQDGTSTPVSSIPQPVMQLHSEKMFAVIAECPHGKFRILQTCDQILMWVVVPTVYIGEMQTIDADIDTKLKEVLGEKASVLVKISTTMPFEPPQTVSFSSAAPSPSYSPPLSKIPVGQLPNPSPSPTPSVSPIFSPSVSPSLSPSFSPSVSASLSPTSSSSPGPSTSPGPASNPAPPTV